MLGKAWQWTERALFMLWSEQEKLCCSLFPYSVEGLHTPPVLSSRLLVKSVQCRFLCVPHLLRVSGFSTQSYEGCTEHDMGGTGYSHMAWTL